MRSANFRTPFSDRDSSGGICAIHTGPGGAIGPKEGVDANSPGRFSLRFWREKKGGKLCRGTQLPCQATEALPPSRKIHSG